MKDRIVSFLGGDNSFIVRVAWTDNLVRKAQGIQDYGKDATRHLGELLTGALLIEGFSKNEKERLSLSLDGDGPLGKIVVRANGKGEVSGRLANPNAAGELGKGYLEAEKDDFAGAPYLTTLPMTGGGVADNLTYYFTTSEQLPSLFSLGVGLDASGKVDYSYGYMVQALPFAKEEVAKKILSNVENGPSESKIISAKMSIEEIAGFLFEGLSYEKTQEKEVRFHCGCSKKTGLSILKLTSRDDLASAIESGAPTEVVCGSCGKKYLYSAEEIASLLKD